MDNDLLARVWAAWTSNAPPGVTSPSEPPESVRQVVEAITSGEDFVLIFARSPVVQGEHKGDKTVTVRTGCTMRLDPRNPLRRARQVAALLTSCEQQVEHAIDHYGMNATDVGVIPLAFMALVGSDNQN